MAVGRIVHWIGVAFVLIAAILLLVTSVGSPTVPDIGLLKVYLKNASDIRESSVVFGPFGYCVLDVAPAATDQDYCSHASVGYLPAQEMRLLVPATVWTTWKGHDLDLMTVSYVLFPLACFVAFCAAGFAFCGVIGSVIAASLAALAWIITFPVMVVAFVSMGYLRSHVRAQGLKANYSTAMWTCLAAFILLFFAMLLLFFSCCTGMRGKNKNRDSNRYNEKHTKHREDSDRSDLNNTHGNGHHYGRDAAVGGAGVGALEAERHHRNKETNGLGHNNRTNGVHDNVTNSGNSNHHYGRDAAIGTAGVGALEAERHHRNKGTTGTGLGHNNRDNMAHDNVTNTGTNNHHLGRDAAVGTAGVGALEAERHHRNKGTTGTGLGHNNRTNDNSHLGRDAAIGTAGLGALEAERHHHNKGTSGTGLGHNNRTNDSHLGRDAALGGAGLGAGALAADHRHHDPSAQPVGLRHTPVNEAAARAEDGVPGLDGYGNPQGGNDYDNVLANQDRQNMLPNTSHHYGRDAALAGGVGAGGLAGAGREHKLRDTMRDSSNRGFEDPSVARGSNRNQGYVGPGAGQTEIVAPVHHITTVGGDGALTHHHPVTTTNTRTYTDNEGVVRSMMETRTHPPNVEGGARI